MRKLRIPVNFVGREEYINTFFDFINNSNKHKNILSFHGVGGIGKTTLKEEITKRLKVMQPQTLQIHLDFRNPGLTSIANALAIISSDIKQTHSDIDFPLFKFADEIYRAKVSPYFSYNQTVNIKLLESGDYVENLIKETGDIIKESGKDLDLIPGIGLLTKTINFLNIGFKRFRDWRVRRGVELIKTIPNMPPHEIEEYLIELWSMDLRRYCIKKQIEAIFIVDAFEKYQIMIEKADKSFEGHSWIEELITNFLEFDWVIFGRDQIKWDDENLNRLYESPQSLEYLSNPQVMSLLEAHFIKNDRIKDLIYKTTKGIPLYIKLCIETYNKIGLRRTPSIEDFQINKLGVVNNFISHLDKHERDTLVLLAVLRKWNTELVNLLIKEHPTGISAVSVTDLFNYSFITKDVLENNWYMHDLVKETLEEKLLKENESLHSHINKTVYSYYTSKLEDATKRLVPINSELINALIEGTYHGVKSNDILLTYLEFQPYNSYFINNGEFSAPTKVMEHFIESAPKNIFYSIFLNDLGDFNIQLQNYERAKKFLKESISNLSLISDDYTLSIVARSHQHLCTLYYKTNLLREAHEEISKALHAYKRMENQDTSNDPKFASIVLDYLALEVVLGLSEDFNNLEILFKNAIKVIDKDSPELARHYHNLGSFYLSHLKIPEALHYFKEAKEIGEHLYPEHPDYAHHRLILQHTILVHASKFEDVEEEEYIQSLEILKKFNIKNIYTAYAYYGLYQLAISKSEVEIAKDNLERAITVLTEISDHSSLLTECYFKLGSIYNNSLNYKQAERYLKEAFRRVRRNESSLDANYSIRIIDSYLNVLYLQKKTMSFIPVYEQRYKQLIRLYGTENDKVLDMLKSLVEICTRFNDTTKAERYRREYIRLRDKK
ncbi:hypothetical protein EMIT0210MI2_12309 [Priestia megaterium]|uniref:tetratricopeptide repeat protein n=1 Tax=Priestia megaterium TaxID=1404 RepID=UPI0039E0CAB9